MGALVMLAHATGVHAVGCEFVIAVGSQTAMRLSVAVVRTNRQAYAICAKREEQLCTVKRCRCRPMISGVAHGTKQSAYGDSRL